MKTQTAWQIWILINRLNDLLWDRYDEECIQIDLHENVDKRPNESERLPYRHCRTKTRPPEDPCLGPLEPLALIDPQNTKAE